jgi:SET domain
MTLAALSPVMLVFIAISRSLLIPVTVGLGGTETMKRVERRNEKVFRCNTRLVILASSLSTMGANSLTGRKVDPTMLQVRRAFCLVFLFLVRRSYEETLSTSAEENSCQAATADHFSAVAEECDAVRPVADADQGNNDTGNRRPTANGYESVPLDCQLVMASSTLHNAGWGVFTLVPRLRGDPVMHGDLVIQISDLNVSTAESMRTILTHYLWSAEETGGFYEGVTVASVLPGIGMISNGLPAPFHNVLPFVPRVDEGGLTRLDAPGAGAITHYHNYTFFAQKDIVAGGEIFVNYGSNWFQERQHLLQMTHVMDGDSKPVLSRSVDWLRQNGLCLDNLRPLQRSRLQPQAGRSVVAARFLPKGSLVAPFPVLPIRRQALSLARPKLDGTIVELQQLLLNYCVGNENSSLLLFPYGPMVNLINHGSDETGLANVRLQWSQHQPRDILERPLADLSQSPLLLELVSTRDIAPGEEIFIDYGRNWTAAWNEHVATWKPPPESSKYAPSYVHDDAIRSLRIESELKTLPYPENIFTSCFYRYSDHKNKSKTHLASSTATKPDQDGDVVVTVQWKQTRGIFELSNLRPCHVLQREHRGGKEGTVFTVQIRNRPQLKPSEVIPKGSIHIVNRVPRHAIRFSDKMYSTDQHLESAFRHEMNSFNDGYPEQWLDLS